jgi:hypothetical protein
MRLHISFVDSRSSKQTRKFRGRVERKNKIENERKKEKENDKNTHRNDCTSYQSF